MLRPSTRVSTRRSRRPTSTSSAPSPSWPNEKFVANAAEEVVEEEREKREAALARKAKLLEALERLKQASG